MILLSLLPGLALPSLVGWLMLDLLEGKTPVLWRGEKRVLGFVLGLTFSMFCVFFANIALGVPFTLTGFLGVFGTLIIAFGIPSFMKSDRAETPHGASLPMPTQTSRPVKAVLAIVGGWVGLRVIVFGLLALVTPSFFDDTTDNWNLRGKLFFFQKTFNLAFPWEPSPGVSSYPPSVSLAKTWMSTIAGTWNEGLVNSIHVVWFIALLLLLYWSLRRMLPPAWAALGPIILASLPLELIHGTNAYADVFLSLHLFVAVSLLWRALSEKEQPFLAADHRGTRAQEWALPHLKLSAFAIALVPFTKNEGWALYFPVLAILFAAALWQLKRSHRITARELARTTGFAAIAILALVLPWIAFKLGNGLAFGNAKGIDWNFQWQPGVLQAIGVNTFLEGNWNLLFVLFFGLLIARWKTALRSPLAVLTLFFAIPYFGQLFAYLTTGLSQEALLQTGYARGLIHLMPVIVVVTVCLLHDTIQGKNGVQGEEGAKENF